MSDEARRALNDCGCCEGAGVRTPAKIQNRPGLDAIAYRVGTHATFKQSMLARLSDARWSVLQALGTRDDDDLSIGLIDAWATAGDSLTFYQERIANEAYLRTATERLSLRELARLIGYELSPGVAASTFLAFTLEDAPGAPDQAIKQTMIDIRTNVQSIPGPGEETQTFETVEKTEARVEWNAIRPRLSRPQLVTASTAVLYLQGTTSNVKPGEMLLLLQLPDRTTARLRRVTAVEPDSTKDRTGVTLEQPAGLEGEVELTALREKLCIFGHNAPYYLSLPSNLTTDTGAAYPNAWDAATAGSIWSIWHDNLIPGGPFFYNNADIFLERSVSGLKVDDYLVLRSPMLTRYYKIADIIEQSLAGFALSAAVTGVFLKHLNDDDLLDNEKNTDLKVRTTAVYTRSERLDLAAEPLGQPLYGQKVALNQIVPGLQPGQALAVTGIRMQLRVTEKANDLELIAADSSARALTPGDLLKVLSAPALMKEGVGPEVLTPEQLVETLNSSTAQSIRWNLMDRDGLVGYLTALSDQVTLQRAKPKDPMVSEMVFIGGESNAVSWDRDRTTITLHVPLQNCYDRETVTINANVARATHGETVREVLGSGDATKTYQTFTLRQPALTYVSADTPSGAESTLRIYVNDVLWREVPFLYGHGPSDRVYVTRIDEDGRTVIRFGDGINGERLPTGQINVRAEYRKGTGLGGLVRRGQLSQLLSRPLGLKEVINPQDAEGAEDPETRDQARRNMPLTVLTLDRAVSLRDYEDFARTFSGIAKAHAVWVWDGRRRSVFITVAGPKAAALDDDGTVIANLKGALRKAGDPYVPFTVKSYRKASFQVHGSVRVRRDHRPEKVLGDVVEELRGAFSFRAREFGQPVALSEVVAIIHRVPGVIAVDVDKLFRNDGPLPPLRARIDAEQPAMGADGVVQSAELLLLDEASFYHLTAVP